jgi:hypothetical protein
MHNWGRIIPLAIACLLPLAGCSAAPGYGAPRAGRGVCVQACDAAMGACSRRCSNRVDDNLCSQECLDELESCKDRCE